MTYTIRKPAFLAACLIFVSATSAAAQSYKVEAVSAPAPQELTVAVRDLFSGDALRVSGPQGVLCEIWLRKAVPATASPNQSLGIAYGKLAEGTLVGAIRFASAAKDYRRQEIKPGLYTLRYGLQPVDGNHQGVSPNRDYLLAIPAAADASLAPVTGNILYNLSRKAAGTGHPSVWSLVPTDNAPANFPAMVHIEDGDLWVLYLRASLQTDGGAAAPATLGLVIVGHAPEA
jgi:hypothetical protein